MAFDAGRITASLDLDRSPFTRSLAAARKSAANFARQTYQASLGVRGSAGAIGELQAVNAEADRVDGRDVELDVDKDGSASSHLQSLSGGFKSLAGNIRATGTVLSASAIPFLIAGIGAATPSILALGASLAGLALNLGKAAAGFGLVGAAAGGGALVGLKAYSSLIGKTLTDSRDLWAKSNEEAVKALEKQRTEILLNARGFNAWNSELNESILRFTRLEAAVGSRVFPTFTRELDAWNEIITQFSPQIANTSGRIAQIATGFTRWFRTADDGRVLSEVVDFLSESAVRAARGLSQLGQIGISAFRPLIPLATDLQGSALGILSATNRWVQSAEGQRKLGQIYRGLWEDAKRLAPVVMDLWRGTVQLFDALDRSGIADQASRGFAYLASAYERATRAGGGLDSFLRGAKQLMPFVAEAAGKVGGAILGIADAVIQAGDKSGRLTILQRIFKGIGNAAKPLQRLVVGTFRDLGPEIAKLIPQAARFLSVFAGSSGPLVTFVRVIRRALEIFNGLPKPIRQAVVNLAALKLILGGLGFGAVVAPMGRFASNMIIARGAAARLAGKSALGGVAAGLASLTIKGGIIGLAIAGVAGLAFVLKRAYDKNKNFRDSVDRLGKKAQAVFSGIKKVINNTVLPALSHLANKGANALLDIFDLNEGKKGKIKSMGSRAGNAYRLGVLGGGGGEGNAWVEAGNKIGKLIARGLNAFANSGRWKGAGFNITKQINSGANPVWVGEQLQKGISGPLRDDVHWRKLGERITRLLGGAATNPAAKNWIQKKLGDAWRWAVNHVNWKSIGNLLVTLFFAPIAPMMSEKSKKNIITPIRNAINAGDWGKLGNNAGFGFLKGFGKALTPDGLVNIVKNAIDAVRHFGKEGSPWGLTEEMGRNAGLGFVKGFRDNLGGVVDAMRRTFDASRQLGPGDPGYLDDGFRKNSRQSAHRGDYGYVQMEDGSWGYNPALYRKQQQMGRTHRYLRNGGGSGFRWNGSEYMPVSSRMGGGSRHGAGRMTDEWMRTLRYLRDHPNNYDIGGDVDIRDTPRKILEFLKRDGWFRRGGSLYHPDTPKRHLPGGGRGNMVRAEDGSMVPRSFYSGNSRLFKEWLRKAESGRLDPKRRTWTEYKQQHGGRPPIDEDGMRRVMREHRSESGGDAVDYNRLAHAIVGAMQSGLPGFIDNSMGGYFHHRTAAGADPR